MHRSVAKSIVGQAIPVHFSRRREDRENEEYGCGDQKLTGRRCVYAPSKLRTWMHDYRLLIIQARKQNAFVLRCQYRVFYATLSFIQERLSLLTETAESVPLQKTALQQEHRYA